MLGSSTCVASGKSLKLCAEAFSPAQQAPAPSGWLGKALRGPSLRQAGTWDPSLQCLHQHKRLLQQQNTKKLNGTKNNCVHGRLGQIMDNKIQKDPKNPTAASEEAGAKPGCWVPRVPPALNTTEGWADHLSPPSGPTPGHTPTLTLYKEPAHPASGSEQGDLLLVLAPSCCSRGPVKPCLNFLSGL